MLFNEVNDLTEYYFDLYCTLTKFVKEDLTVDFNGFYNGAAKLETFEFFNAFIMYATDQNIIVRDELNIFHFSPSLVEFV